MKSSKSIGMSYIGDSMKIKELVIRVEGEKTKTSVSIADEEGGVMLLVPLAAIFKALREGTK